MKEKGKKKARKKIEALALSKLLESEFELLGIERERLELQQLKRRLKLQRKIYKREGWRSYVV